MPSDYKVYSITYYTAGCYPFTNNQAVTIIAKNKKEFGKLFKLNDKYKGYVCRWLNRFCLRTARYSSCVFYKHIIKKEITKHKINEIIYKIADEDMFDNLIMIDELVKDNTDGIIYSIEDVIICGIKQNTLDYTNRIKYFISNIL